MKFESGINTNIDNSNYIGKKGELTHKIQEYISMFTLFQYGYESS